MSETGWPLIPREILPAPVKPAKTRVGPRLPGTPGDAGRQLSIFGAETTEPSPADLAGLLAGPGRLGRMGGTARVSVTVDAPWRVHALVTELVSRGLVVNWHEEVRDDAPPIVADSSRPSETPVKEETSVRRPSVAATFDPDADPTPDLPSDVDFLPDADLPDADFPDADLPDADLPDADLPPDPGHADPPGAEFAPRRPRSGVKAVEAPSEVPAYVDVPSDPDAVADESARETSKPPTVGAAPAAEAGPSPGDEAPVKPADDEAADTLSDDARPAQPQPNSARPDSARLGSAGSGSAGSGSAGSGSAGSGSAGSGSAGSDSGRPGRARGGRDRRAAARAAGGQQEAAGRVGDPPEEGAEGPESPEPPPKRRFAVVTAYSSRLNPLARAWPDAAAQLFLSGPRLRLWVAAAGEPVPGGYALGLGAAKDDPEQLRAIDAALVRAGLAGRLSDDRHHYVIAGQRRLRRLAELVGERPAAAPPELWPGGAGA
jgi:hypothetical protein